MAARKRNWQTNKTREKIRDTIKTGQLVQRLEKHALGDGETEKLTATQLKAAQILLDRTMPVLSSAEITEHTEETTPESAYNALVKLLGEDKAKEIAGHLIPRTEHEPGHA
jgi:ribosomal protein L16/L10AE